MYPFNRTTSIHAESHIEEEEDSEEEIAGILENGNNKNHVYRNQVAETNTIISAEPRSPVEKTILASILELSDVNNKWVTTMRRSSRLGRNAMGQRESIFECSWRGVHCVSNSLRPLLMFFRILAIFPTDCDRRIRRRRSNRTIIKYCFYLIYVLCVILLNSYLISFNIRVLGLYRVKFGLMHTGTVASMITATKPVINVVVIFLSLITFRQHRRLLKTIDMVDVCFRSAFNVSPSLKIYKFVFFLILFFVFMSSLTLKILEFIGTEQVFGHAIMSDMSFLIVPLLSLWNIIPLLYYHLYNVLIRFYCRTLIRSMNREHKKRHFSLKFYYEQFLRITNVQEAVGEVFNPFLLFSLAWSLIVVCLTIYFLSEDTSVLLVPITSDQINNLEIRNKLNTTVHYSICWATYQLIMALFHIAMICATGMRTNETTRQIVNAVLRIVPDANADLDRFQISCFVHKMTTQFMWGMTVWRAFPLERATFFTILSLVVTYSLILFRFKENHIPRDPMNSTYTG